MFITRHKRCQARRYTAQSAICAKDSTIRKETPVHNMIICTVTVAANVCSLNEPEGSVTAKIFTRVRTHEMILTARHHMPRAAAMRCHRTSAGKSERAVGQPSVADIMSARRRTRQVLPLAPHINIRARRVVRRPSAQPRVCQRIQTV